MDGVVDFLLTVTRRCLTDWRMTIVRIFTLCAVSAVLLWNYGLTGVGEQREVSSNPSFSFRVVRTGLESPWEISWAPDNHLWVTERVGKRIIRINPEDGRRVVVVEIPEAYQSVQQDGVLGMAFHPEFLDGTGHDYVYVGWTYDSDGGEAVDVRGKIQRFTYNRASLTLEEPTDLITHLPAHDDHIGGRLVVGLDRKLYFSIGDQGGNWQRNRCNPILSQVLPSADEVGAGDWVNYQGKILRLNLDGSIPDDNPIIDGVRSHVFSYGHRNPQGLVFDSEGRLFAAEHGPSTDDEVNRIEAGGNYGWPRVAGDLDDQAYSYVNWSASSPTPCGELPNTREAPASVPIQMESDWNHPAFKRPLVTFFTVGSDYDFTASGAATVAASGLGIYAYTNGVPGWADSLLLASLKQGIIYRMSLNEEHDRVTGEPEQMFKSTNRYRDIAIRPDGKAFYIVTDNTGRSQNDMGESTGDLENPGAVLEFTYVKE